MTDSDPLLHVGHVVSNEWVQTEVEERDENDDDSNVQNPHRGL